MYQIHPEQLKSVRKWIQEALHCSDLETRQDQGQWKWYKMVEVNGSYKHGQAEKNWFKSLHLMSSVKLFPHKMDCRMKAIHYIYQYVTHFDQ